MDLDEFQKFYESHIHNSSEKLAFLTPKTSKKDLDMNLNSPGLELKEILFKSQSSLMFVNNLFLFDLIQDVIENLVETGTLQHLKELNSWYDYFTRLKSIAPRGPQVLSMMDLDYGFIIWLVACGLCVCILFGEFFIKFLNYYVSKFYFLVVLKNSLENFQN